MMKKIFLYISILAAAMSCETMYGPVQTPLKADKADGIEIKVNSTGDNTASFTLAPAGEASYYSYLVDEADAPEKLDSSLLFSCKYSGIAQGTVKWTSEVTSKTISLDNLSPNTTYQIYAVAGSPMGFPGSVVITSFKTSDKVAPEFTGFETQDNLVGLAFSEDIVLGEGRIIAEYYAFNDPNFEEGIPVGTVEADMTKVAVEGNIAVVAFEGLPDGAFYAVSYTEGTFKDPSGNQAVALKSSMKLNEDYEAEGEGIYGRKNTISFKLGELDGNRITDWESPLMIDFGSEYGYGYTYSKATGSAVYSHSGKTTTMQMTPGSDFGYSSEKVVIFLPEEPERGDAVTLNIAAETFEDFYGNLNEAWSADLLYPYSYTLDDVVGNYTAQYINALNGNAGSMSLSIAATTEEDEASEDFIEGCNVKFTTFGFNALFPIYASFDAEKGTLTIPSYQIYTRQNMGQTPVYLVFMTITGNSPDTTTPTVLHMPESGILTDQSSMFGILIFDQTGSPLGWYTACNSFTAQKTAAEGTSSLMSFTEQIKSYPLDVKFVVE